jgi:cytochrome c oxidase accessory protein FixG
MLLDLGRREFVLLGASFRPSDGFMLMLFGLTIVLTVFLITALFGRAWCGWGCPQTVYLEFVFRPIERLLEGNPSEIRRRDKDGVDGRRVLKWAIYLVLAFLLANVFLSYFVGTERLFRWITTSPAKHPFGFGVVVFVTGMMFFDFAWFREQTCIVACPYGRLQSVLLDKQSLIVGYDSKRGEPRGKPARSCPCCRTRPPPRPTAPVSTAGRVSRCARPASTSATACRWSASAAPSVSTPATRSWTRSSSRVASSATPRRTSWPGSAATCCGRGR